MEIACEEESDVETTYSDAHPDPSTATRNYNPPIPVVRRWHPSIDNFYLECHYASYKSRAESSSQIPEETSSYYNEWMEKNLLEPEWLARSYCTPNHCYNSEEAFHGHGAEHHDKEFEKDGADLNLEYDYFE